ncbi:MAG: hypothetical protein EOS55_13880 [Mesorhizobium sp.]|nr:MAG: hypothetical protein EOS55_13880 [Mesorhizobium sp.]
MVDNANSVWRAYVDDGDPSSGANKPKKVEIREWGTWVEESLAKSRDALTADRIYYVRTDGSDSNNGLVDNAGGAFLTIQKAIDTVAKTLDFRGFDVTIQVRAGTYTGDGRLDFPLVGNGTLTVLGDLANWDNVSIIGGFYATNGAQFFVRGLKISSTAAGTWSIFAQWEGSNITCSHINFGAVTGGADHLYASDRGAWHIDDVYEISGGALNHYHVTEGGHGRVAPVAVTVTGTPHFSGQFAGVASGDLAVLGPPTYSGPATGRAYLVHLNGVIRSGATNSRTVFPGDVHGVEQSGGRFDLASMFSADKGGANQVIANGNWVKVLFPNVPYLQGQDYSNSSWNPRYGCVMISATVTFTAINAVGEICGVSIFKNGAEYKSVLFTSDSTSNPQSATITIIDLPIGSDVYDVYARGGNTGNSTISGAVTWSHWMGKQF